MRQEANVAIQLLDSVSIILNLAPVPGLQAVWKGFKCLWDLVQEVRQLFRFNHRVPLKAHDKSDKSQVHEGRSQLEVLSGSIAVFLRALDQKLHDSANLAISIEEDVDPLLRWVILILSRYSFHVHMAFFFISSLIEEICEFARKQARKPFLKRFLQGDEVTTSVTAYHHRLLHVYNVFSVSWPFCIPHAIIHGLRFSLVILRT